MFSNPSHTPCDIILAESALIMYIVSMSVQLQPPALSPNILCGADKDNFTGDVSPLLATGQE